MTGRSPKAPDETGPDSREKIQGDPQFRAVFEAHLSYVLRTLRRLGARDRDLDDLAQEVFLVLFRRRDEFDFERSPRAYLFRIAHNLVRAHRRRAVEKTSASSAPLQDDHQGKSDPNIRALVAADVVYRALDALDEEGRAVFVLIDLEGGTAGQAAETLGLSERTAYNRLRTARETFKETVRKLLGEEL